MIYFGVVFSYFWALIRSIGLQMCSLASLDVEERGWSGKLSQGKDLRLLQHHFTHFSEVPDGMPLLGGVSGYF